MRRRTLAALVLTLATMSVVARPPGASSSSNPRAVQIARAVLERLGGQEAWDTTRFVRWKFFGGRQHYWDRHTGDVRIEMAERRNDAGEVERGREARSVRLRGDWVPRFAAAGYRTGRAAP